MPKIDEKLEQYTKCYSDYYATVFSAVYLKIGNIDEVKDICQEIFTRFYLKFDEVENPRKWLLGTLRYVLLEFYRKNKDRHLDIDEVFDDVHLTFVNGFRDTRLIIEEAINNIEDLTDSAGQILLELVAIRKLSYREAAKELGITMGQARYRYRIIINKIIEYLKKKGISSLEELL